MREYKYYMQHIHKPNKLIQCKMQNIRYLPDTETHFTAVVSLVRWMKLQR